MTLPSETLEIIFTGKEQSELRKVPLPPLKPDHVLVRATVSLISCGTETIAFGRLFDDSSHWNRYVKYPFAAGYSHVGVVEAVGDAVSQLKVGDRVVSPAPHTKFVIWPESRFIPIPPQVSDRDAAWCILSYVAQNGVRGVGTALGDDVAVIGMGPIGQLAVQFLRAAGARHIIAIDPLPKRLKFAEPHATHTLAMGADAAAEQVLKINGGRLCDVVYDVTGNDKVFAAAQGLVRRLGAIGLIGDTGSPSGQHLTSDVISKSLRIIATHGTCAPPSESDWAHWTHRNMIQLFLEFLTQGRMRVSEMNTHEFAPEDCQSVYQRLLRDRSDAMGCHFVWD